MDNFKDVFKALEVEIDKHLKTFDDAVAKSPIEERGALNALRVKIKDPFKYDPNETLKELEDFLKD